MESLERDAKRTNDFMLTPDFAIDRYTFALFEVGVMKGIENERGTSLVVVPSRLEIDVLQESAQKQSDPRVIVSLLESTSEENWTSLKEDGSTKKISTVMALPITRSYYSVTLMQMTGGLSPEPAKVVMEVAVVNPRGKKERLEDNVTTVIRQDQILSSRDYKWDRGERDETNFGRRLSTIFATITR